jgi:RNA polymerase sigma-70 factor (ECF subfamily)
MAINWSDAPEAQVILLARTGDDQAFGELVRRRQGAMRHFLRRLSGNAALADDLAQDVFVKAWRMLGDLKSPLAFGAWLRQIAVRCWLDHVRRHPKADQVLDDLADELAAPATSSVQKLDLDRALTGLSGHERLCVVLAYGEGLSHSEIAIATGLALGTVKTHVTRGAAKLRQILSEPVHD